MRRLLAMLAAGVVLIAGCSSGPAEGVVYDKEYTAAWTQYAPVCSKGCVIVPIHHSEKWEIKLCPRRPTTEGECGWRSVSSEEYSAVEIGDYYKEAQDDE